MSYKYVLSQFITSPEKFADDIIYREDEFVVVKDAFPKAVHHYLIMPRSKEITYKNPLEVLSSNQELLAKIKQISVIIKERIVKQMKDKYGLEIGDEFVKVGVHSIPSLNNLHVHVITKDFSGDKMKNAKHYNSFNTKFFVDIDEFPLDSFSERFNQSEMEALEKKADLVCLHCGTNYHRKFAELKRHLQRVFEESVRNHTIDIS